MQGQGRITVLAAPGSVRASVASAVGGLLTIVARLGRLTTKQEMSATYPNPMATISKILGPVR